jgi:hypothetical protein
VLTASDLVESMGQVTETKTEILYQSVQKVVKKQTNYSISAGGKIQMPIADRPLGIF